MAAALDRHDRIHKSRKYDRGFLRYHRFTAVHSVWNKVCGVAVFLSPLFIGAECAWQAKAPAAMAVCVIASIAAVQESVCITKGGRAE